MRLRCLLLVCAVPGLLSAAEPVLLGSFQLQPCVSIYVVVDQPCAATLTVHQGGRSTPDRILARCLDPDEQPAYWRYVEYLPAADIPAGHDPRLDLRDSATPPQPNEAVLSADLELDRPGVWQFRVVGGDRNSRVELSLARELPYGVSFQNGEYTPWSSGATWYLYLPPHAERLTLKGGPGSLNDAAGQSVLKLDGKTQTVPINRTDTVCSLTFDDPAKWALRAADMPVILCPTAAAAKAIHGSVEVLPDGTVVCHKVQARIHALLPKLLAPDKVGVASQLVKPLTTRRDALLADPLRSQLLLQGYLPTIERWLGTQNVDPQSRWGGCLDGWQDQGTTRWDTLTAVKGCWAGASAHNGNAAEHLGLAALDDNPANPYHGETQLLYRAAAAALFDLQVLAEDEVWPGIADLDPYPGNMAFPSAQKTFPVFGLVAPQLSAEVRQIWSDALRPIVDRHYADYLVSARNQSSHRLVAFEAYAEGSGDPLYEQLSKLFAGRWCRGQSAGGYYQEATGPCASYIGMTHFHEGVSYRLTGDERIKQSLRDGYALFNSTVAPDPDGTMLGGFNFNHRVGEGFYFEQWGGAKGLADDIPEVGLWAGPRGEAQVGAAKAWLEKWLTDPSLPRYPDHSTARYLAWTQPDHSVGFPAEETKPFIRNFADQLIAVKRPGYYTYVWVGHPAAGEFYIRGKDALRKPFPGDVESTGGDLPNVRKITPFLGGGLSGFWTREFGHGLLAANWSPTTHHGLTATAADGLRYWEDYFANSFELDEAQGTLTIDGKVEGVPLSYVRTYRFEPDELQVELDLTADDNIALSDLVETIPFCRHGWDTKQVTVTAGGVASGEVKAASFRLTDPAGAGMEGRFDGPQQLRLFPDGLRAGGWRKLQFGRVEVVLPARLSNGQTVTLSYRLRGFGRP